MRIPEQKASSPLPEGARKLPCLCKLGRASPARFLPKLAPATSGHFWVEEEILCLGFPTATGDWCRSEVTQTYLIGPGWAHYGPMYSLTLITR
jgi:hypothetical protein